MTDTVLDASAMLADIWDEPGAEVVRATRSEAIVSAVNFAEFISKLIDRGMSGDEARQFVDQLAYRVVAADEAQALVAGLLREKTRRTGLSLGDRFCLALAREAAAPVLTSDRAWKDLDLGVEIVLIR
jgi:PIN domain nuclease of toxin-antitoxin system